MLYMPVHVLVNARIRDGWSDERGSSHTNSARTTIDRSRVLKILKYARYTTPEQADDSNTLCNAELTSAGAGADQTCQCVHHGARTSTRRP